MATKTPIKKVAHKPSVKTMTKTSGVSKEREKALNDLILNAEKKYGSNVLYKGFPKKLSGEEIDDLTGIPRISTTIPSLDIDLGGGIPIGRYTEIMGGLSTYKSTICSHIAREFQKKYNKSVLFSDAEGTMTEEYCEQLGLDPTKMIYNPNAGLEEATQLILDTMDADNDVKLAIVDSLEALVPMKEYAKEMDESKQMGMKPTLLGEFFRKFQAKNNYLARNGKMPFTLIAINQLREKIGAYGNPEYAPGGRAKGFTASVILKLRRGDFITEGSGDNKVIVGHTIKYNVEKNKTAVPQRVGEFDMYCDDDNSAGIKSGYCDIYLSIIMEALSFDLIERSGAYFYLAKDSSKKFQGKDKLIDYLKSEPNTILELQNEIMDLLSKTK